MQKRKFRIKSIFILIFTLMCIIGLVYSLYSIGRWEFDNRKVKKIQNEIKENIIIKKPTEKEKSILDDYYINFEELKKINSEVVGYIKVENTSIDSTIVKHSDNDYYLNHTFDHSWNKAGWIFSHYRNKYDGTDKNYVVFGHSRTNGNMFGTLKNILTEEWQNTNNKIIFITENSKNIYEVFSVYKIKAEDYYITTNFANDEVFGLFIKTIKSRSLKDFNVEVTTDDKLLTLSTCDETGKNRIVLHAKEIKEN